MQNFGKTLEIINEKVENHKIKYISINEKLFAMNKAKKIEIIQNKINQYIQRQRQLTEQDKTKNEFAIQQYDKLILQLKNWIIAEKMK